MFIFKNNLYSFYNINIIKFVNSTGLQFTYLYKTNYYKLTIDKNHTRYFFQLKFF